MMPRTGSYGETPTVTRSPGTTLIRKRRILPLSWASTSWPASHCTRYNPPLWTATTVPCMSIRSSLLKLLAILSVLQTNIVPYGTGISKRADGVFDPLGERLVVVAGQNQWLYEGDSHRSGLGHLPAVMQDFVEALDSDGDDRHVETRGNHPDSGPERPDLSSVGPLTLGKDEHRKAVLENLADVPHRLTCAGFALRQRERVEEQGRQIVVEAVREPRLAAELLGEKVG